MGTADVSEYQPQGLEAAASPDYVYNWLGGVYDVPPEALPEASIDRLCEVNGILPDAEAVNELALLQQTKAVIDTLPSPKLREGVRYFLSGHHESLLRTYAPQYRRAVRALKERLAETHLATESQPEERGLSEAAAHQVVAAAEAIIEDQSIVPPVAKSQSPAPLPKPRVPEDQSLIGRSVIGTNKPLTQRDIDAYLSLPKREDPLAWQRQGACKDASDPEVFWRSGAEQDAVDICLGCKVREICLAWALPQKQLDGVWGAMTIEERRVERSRRNRAAKRATAA